MWWVLQQYQTVFGWPEGLKPVYRVSSERTRIENLPTVLTYIISTATILSCLFMKVPQIMNLRQMQSTEGINVHGILMEIVAFTVVTLYNFINGYSVMTYLEYPILLFQVVVMLYYALVIKDLLPNPIVPLGALAYLVTVIGFASGLISKEYLDCIFTLCPPLSAFAKLSYIYGIITAGNADNVSLATWGISVFVNISRIYTVFADSRDMKLITNFAMSAVLSCAVFFTAFYYQKMANNDSCNFNREQKSEILELLRALKINVSGSK